MSEDDRKLSFVVDKVFLGSKYELLLSKLWAGLGYIFELLTEFDVVFTSL